MGLRRARLIAGAGSSSSERPLRQGIEWGGSNAAAGRFRPMPHPHDPAYNRDDEQKPASTPGRSQRSAYEPRGAEGDAATPKTFTDPGSGESTSDTHAPNQADADQTDGVRRRGAPGATDR